MAYVKGRVQRCDNGNGLGLANLSDNVGSFAQTDINGFFETYNAYDGYRLRAAFPGMLAKETVFTKGDISAGWITICLDEDPEYVAPKPTNPRCALTQILGGNVEQLWAPSGFLWSLARFRDQILASSALGRRAISYYDNEAFAREVVRLSRSEPEFQAALIRTALSVYPFVLELMNGRLGEPVPPDEAVRFSEGMYESITALTAQLRRATTNDDLMKAIEESEPELRRFVGLTPRDVLDILT